MSRIEPVQKPQGLFRPAAVLRSGLSTVRPKAQILWGTDGWLNAGQQSA
jgi:hypothetical protein